MPGESKNTLSVQRLQPHITNPWKEEEDKIVVVVVVVVMVVVVGQIVGSISSKTLE